MSLNRRMAHCVINIPFSAAKIKESDCLWMNNDDLERLLPKIDHKHYLKDLAAIVTPNPFFENVRLTDHQVVYTAEQYGGEGVGFNGGGVRCGNVEKTFIQLKGIGVTPVVGFHENLYNSYGAYPLYEAITEVINHQIYKTILPVKPLSYLAIIHIGESPFFVTAEQCTLRQNGSTPIAIGVREKAVRVGHFIPSPYYKPHKDYIHEVMDDKERVRSANSRLNASLQNKEALFELLNQFLINTANLMGFCQINRIAHGALTASNVAIDGSWLDLTNTTFVPPGYKQITGAGNLHSYEEQYKAFEILSSFLKSFTKVSGFQLNHQKIKNVYYKALRHYKSVYLFDLFGLDIKTIKGVVNKDVDILLNGYLRVLDEQPYLLRGVPVAQKFEGGVESSSSRQN